LQSIKLTGKGNGFYGKKHSDSAKARISAANKGNQINDEQRAKIAASKLGKKRGEFSEEWKANLVAAHTGGGNGMYGKKHSAEAKAKQSAKAIGRKQSEETKQKKADAIRGLVREKKLCPHCNQEVAVNGYARWHGDKCKSKKDEK
jgi:flagellar hook assembly protein FlgD